MTSEREFAQRGFEVWWQLRATSKVYKRSTCPWCKDLELTRDHLQNSCGKFAEACWTRGVRPEDAFDRAPKVKWYAAALAATWDLAVALNAQEDEDVETSEHGGGEH